MTPSLFAHDSGGGHTALVLLHGFGAFHGVWDGIVSRPAGSTRIIAYDLPGHGGSLAMPGSRPSASSGMIASDLRSRGVRTAHLAGHSMGGAIAMLIALAEPQLAASLSLLAPGGFGPEINVPLLCRYAEAVSREEIRACLLAMSGPGSNEVADNSIDAIQRMRAMPGQAESLVAIAAAITRGDRQGEIPRASMADLQMPVRIMWGTDDPVLPFSQSAGLPDSFAIMTAPGAGHMLIEERADSVAAFVSAAVS